MSSQGSTKKQTSHNNNHHWVEFKTLKDLFSFIITKSIPGQQFLSVIRFRDYTYSFTPIDDSVMVFFTKETPKSPIYAWDPDRDEFVTLPKPDRTKVNILIQEVAQDTLISKLFYS
ncbi:MAG TPA: hypothetical protein VFF30_19065 [Nitrososphaerales archaeon]|nr:hypothetical protein [Nitrososphaerales archaeon]